jgi:invasion protein IalB
MLLNRKVDTRLSYATIWLSRMVECLSGSRAIFRRHDDYPLAAFSVRLSPSQSRHTAHMVGLMESRTDFPQRANEYNMRSVPMSFARWSAGALFTTILATSLAAQQPIQQPAPRPSPQRPPQAQVGPPAPAASPAAVPSAPSAVPTQGGTPQRTTATYDDWVVQCETQPGPPPVKACEMTQVTQLQVQGKSQPFSRAAILRPAKDHPSRMVIQVPVNVSFSTNVRVQISDADPGLAVPFARCVPSGCFAEFDLKDDALKKFRSASAAGKLSFSDASGHEFSVPFSFNGLGQAYDALMKE